jgi:hypothetical protein
MAISAAVHLLRGRISGESEARSVTRWAAWLHLALTFVLFIFWQVVSFWVNALADLTTEGVVNESVFLLVVVTSPIWMLVRPCRAASLGMIVTAVLEAALTGACGLFFLSLSSKFPVRPGDFEEMWPLAFGAFAFAWLGMGVLSWRAFQAANFLRRQGSASGAALIAREFD